MTFLELVLRSRQECRSAGTAPTTVAAQTGMNKKFVDWVAQSWIDIQASQEHWKWMRYEFSFPVVAAVAEYTPLAAGLTDFARWHVDTFRLYLTASGVADEQLIVHDPDYDCFRDTHRYGIRQSGRPGLFALRPRDEAIMFDVTPEDAYTCVGDYHIEPVLLAVDADEPAVEDRFHMLIVYETMIKYGIDQAAAEIIAKGTQGRISLLAEFERRYLPKVSS